MIRSTLGVNIGEEMTAHRGRWFLAGFLILVVNSGYLAVFAEASLFYVTNVLLHLVLGISLSTLALPAAKRFVLRQPHQSALWMVAVVALSLAAATGFGLVLLGNLRPMRTGFGLRQIHIVTE